MPDLSGLSPLTITHNLAHPRGVTVEVTVVVDPDSAISHRVTFPDLTRMTAGAAAETVVNVLDAADQPPF